MCVRSRSPDCFANTAVGVRECESGRCRMRQRVAEPVHLCGDLSEEEKARGFVNKEPDAVAGSCLALCSSRSSKAAKRCVLDSAGRDKI